MSRKRIGGGAELPAPPPARSAAAGARVVFAEAPWCGECKRIAPLVEAVAADHPDVRVERIDASVETNTTRDLRVMATPTLIGFAGEEEVARIAGRRGRDEIERFFAAIESGTSLPHTSRADVVLRAGGGLLLVVLGVFAGPSWPMVGFGAAVSGYGLVGLLPRRR